MFMTPHPANFTSGEKDKAGRGLEGWSGPNQGPPFPENKDPGGYSLTWALPASWASL